MAILDIVRSLGQRKQTELELAATAKQRLLVDFNKAVAEHCAGREVDQQAVSDYLETVAAPEKTWQEAEQECRNSIKRDELQTQLAELVAAKSEMVSERRSLELDSRWREGLVLESGPLAAVAMRARTIIDNATKPKAAMFADWRTALRVVEDTLDRIELIDVEVRYLDRDITRTRVAIDNLNVVAD
ncbi:hypothetical protein Pla22_45540 [Rubripirellula amarantea]|uniref:Uncharacterized protein n=1 Tax=Rubripirellula amarantea TaxID=2527999 RepID=A0A5C5WEZ8_9BACT|nr:hypothetical protein [Rubripirellula amarantea]TWT49358.1 hypothetical protein Pla22_45540 [Rubripirellula amarantea]